MKRPFALILTLVFLALAALLASRCGFVVDETEFVLLSDFGRIVAVLGDHPNETGLHWKLPWRSTIRLDRRLQVAEPPTREVLTGDKRNLEVAPYVVWQVADPLRFYQSCGTLDAASARLEERVSASESDALSQTPLDALASTDPSVWSLDSLTRSILDDVRPAALSDLGIAVLDVRLKRFNHPLEVRPAIFDLIRSERLQVAAKLRAEGQAEYDTLTSRADRDRDEQIARAEADAARLRAQGEAAAARLLNQAHARNPQFYELLRTLDTYRSILDARATVILSTSSPLLRLLNNGPSATLPEPTPADPSTTQGALSSPETSP